jgi:hypothetical protein
MKTLLQRHFLCLMFLGAGLISVFAAQPDQRLDGIWIGTETVMMQEMHGMLKSEPIAQSRPAKIAIAQGGTLLGVLEGYGTGRYSDVKRVGNTIVFHAGQRTGQLTLSADGNTLTEKGIAPIPAIIVNYGSREGALSGAKPRPLTFENKPLMTNAPVTGVFHRQK